MRRIGRAHGEGHLALVLRLVVETEGNARELYSETMWAISELLRNRPDLLDRGVVLFDDFDRIDLRATRAMAKSIACGVPVSHAMRILLALQLRQTPPDVPGDGDDADKP